MAVPLLLRSLFATIVLIVAVLVASPGSAHSGHRPGLAASSHASVVTMTQPDPVAAEIASARVPADEPSDQTPCGGCCVACHASALPAEVDLSSPCGPRGDRLAASAVPAWPDHVPDALPEPPRPSA